MSVDCLLCCFSQQFILKILLLPSFPKSGRRKFGTLQYNSVHITTKCSSTQILFRDVLRDAD